MYADLTDVDNFNHKHGGTLMFNEDLNSWIYIDSIADNFVYGHIITSARGNTSRWQAPVKDKPRLLRRSPDVQFYNDLERGESLFFRRKPRRSMRHTITMESADIRYPFWNALPQALSREIQQDIFSCDRITKLCWLLNNNQYFTFNEALKKVQDAEMISCAFEKNFMVSLSIKKANSYLLWYSHIPIGNISIENERVIVDRLILLQEVKDILRTQNCPWTVVG